VRLSIRVIPHASRSESISLGDSEWKVKLQPPPQDGRANRALIQLLAQHFHLPKKCFKIVAGKKSQQKIVEIFHLPQQNCPNN
jgi:uncharacterized protein (TIGR00251 family)